MDNVDAFNEVVGHILADLYVQFPVPIELNITDYCQFIGTANITHRGNTNENEEAQAAIQFVNSSIAWLHQEGYILWEQSYGNVPGKTVLTSKGLQILISLPENLQSSIGDQLRQKTMDGVKSGFGELAKQAVAAGGMFLMKAAIKAVIEP